MNKKQKSSKRKIKTSTFCCGTQYEKLSFVCIYIKTMAVAALYFFYTAAKQKVETRTLENSGKIAQCTKTAMI